MNHRNICLADSDCLIID